MGASGMEQLHKIAAVIFVAQVGNATELGNAGVVTGIQLCVLLTRSGNDLGSLGDQQAGALRDPCTIVFVTGTPHTAVLCISGAVGSKEQTVLESGSLDFQRREKSRKLPAHGQQNLLHLFRRSKIPRVEFLHPD